MSETSAAEPQLPWWRTEVTTSSLVRALLLTVPLAACLAALLNFSSLHRPWDVEIRGGVQRETPISLKDITVDVELPRLGRKITFTSQQFMIRKQGLKKFYYPLPKALTEYAIDWHEDGSFLLHLRFDNRLPPTTCFLTFHPGKWPDVTTSAFPLRPRYPGDHHFSGDAPVPLLREKAARMPVGAEDLPTSVDLTYPGAPGERATSGDSSTHVDMTVP